MPSVRNTILEESSAFSNPRPRADVLEDWRALCCHSLWGPRSESISHCADTANLRTKILDFRGSDSSIILILRDGFSLPIGNLAEGLSQAILVGRLGVGGESGSTARVKRYPILAYPILAYPSLAYPSQSYPILFVIILPYPMHCVAAVRPRSNLPDEA